MMEKEWQKELLRLRQRVLDFQEDVEGRSIGSKHSNTALLDLQQHMEAVFVAWREALQDTVQQLAYRRQLLEVYTATVDIEGGAHSMLLDDLCRFYFASLERWLVQERQSKVRINLTVDEMLIMIRMMQQVGMIETDQLGTVFNKLSLHFASQRQENISEASLRRKYSAITVKKFERLEELIRDMLQRLEQINERMT